MHILFIYPHPYYFTNPTIAYLLEEIEKRTDIKVTLVIPEQNELLPNETNQLTYWNYNFQVIWPRKIWKWGKLIYQFYKLFSFTKNQNVDKIIAIDPEGLIVGGRLKRLLPRVELHYFPFEILFWEELTNFRRYQKIKMKEVFYSRLVDVLVIQDIVRKELVFSQNEFSADKLKVYYVPVAPRRSISLVPQNIDFRKSLGIDNEDILLIHSGSVAKWSGAEMLIELLKSGLPPGFKLLIHCKHKLDDKNELHAELIRLQQEGFPVVLHDNAFPDYQEYLEFVKCADFGLAFYVADPTSPYTGKNIEEIGLASGKFSCYMSLGMPAMVTKARIYEQLNEKYNFGLLVSDSGELSYQLPDCKKNNNLESGISKLFDQELDPEKFGKDYLTELVAI